MQTKTIPITILRNLFFMLSKLLAKFRFVELSIPYRKPKGHPYTK